METADGNESYISSERPGGQGGRDIWRIRHLSEQTPEAENLGPVTNSSSFDVSPCIAPDGSYPVFGSERDGRRGEAHLYISFKKGNGEWTDPLDMNSCGAEINNDTAHHNSPSLPPDGKPPFFVRHEDMMDMDVYRVSTDVIGELKGRAMAD